MVIRKKRRVKTHWRIYALFDHVLVVPNNQATRMGVQFPKLGNIGYRA